MKSLNVRTLGLVTVMWLVGGASAFAATTEEVWDHHVQAWGAKSVGSIVEDYNEDSVLVLNNQVFKGQKKIANVFTQLFKIFNPGVNTIDTPLVFDRFVYITWHLKLDEKPEFFGTDTFVIENGKIALQTIASPLYIEFPVIP